MSPPSTGVQQHLSCTWFNVPILMWIFIMTIFNTDIPIFYTEKLVPFNNFYKQKGRRENSVFNLRIKLQKKKKDRADTVRNRTGQNKTINHVLQKCSPYTLMLHGALAQLLTCPSSPLPLTSSPYFPVGISLGLWGYCPKANEEEPVGLVS